MQLTPKLVLVSCLIGWFAPCPRAGAALADPPHQTIHFLAEHVPEIAQDAVHFTLPWPAEGPAAGVWQSSVQVGYLSAASGFLDLEGPLLAAAAAYGLNDQWAIEGTAFYGDFKMCNTESDEILWATFLLPNPLDLPERAHFSDTGGKVVQRGIGLGLYHRLSAAGAARPWYLRFGLLAEQLEARNFQMHYRLLGGRDAGAEGILDHSFEATFFTPYLGIATEWRLGKSWRLRPRANLGLPLPPAEFDARLTGPGFDRSSREAGGRPEKVGDPYVGLGAGLLHLPSGLEIDLGTTLFFGTFGEHLSHASAESPILLVLTWHFR